MMSKYAIFTFVTILCVAATSALAGEIDPGLQSILDLTPAQEPVSVLVFLQEQVDIKGLDNDLTIQGVTLRQRHEIVVRSLQEKAATTQQELVDYLDYLEAANRVDDFRIYWVSNIIQVTATKAEIEIIAHRSDVAKVYYNYELETIKPVEINSGEPDVGTAVEPGLTAIRAPEAWALGYTGAGVLVANIDTGVEGDHPALASKWAGVADPRYAGHPEWAWYDPYLGQNDFPYDYNGHGTHTMGTICGSAAGNDIGVAPGAYWIAAGAIDRGGGIPQTVADAIASFEWMLDPDGNPTTDWDVPDVCSNSWGLTTSHGYPPCDPLFWQYLDACEAAGTVVLFAAGNEGTSGLRRPADRATDDYRTCAVAAVDGNTAGYPIAYFSSRGPTYCTPTGDPAIKPDIAAPGVSVRSSYPGGSYVYMSGTSMACPHIAGVVALLRDANPNLGVNEIKQIMYETALDLGTAGEDNSYGWGLVDAYEAVLLATPDSLPPIADFYGDPTSGYAPLGVQFTDASANNPTSWDWDFGDGVGTSNDQNPYYTYTDTGSYTVTLTVTNEFGSDTEIKTDYIVVTEQPVDNIHVADIVVTRYQSSKVHWTGRATVTIVDDTGVPVEGATVYGYFNAPDSRTEEGITGGNGVAVIDSRKTKTPPADWCFEVTDVVKAGETYDPTENLVTRACESGWVYKFTALPADFTLEQNRPNPFNPTTEIGFILPVSAHATLDIYNIAGQKVATLIDRQLPAGRHSVEWNASAHPSGVYLYRLTADRFAQTKKMMLLK